jgi:hypothetical protein
VRVLVHRPVLARPARTRSSHIRHQSGHAPPGASAVAPGAGPDPHGGSGAEGPATVRSA